MDCLFVVCISCNFSYKISIFISKIECSACRLLDLSLPEALTSHKCKCESNFFCNILVVNVVFLKKPGSTVSCLIACAGGFDDLPFVSSGDAYMMRHIFALSCFLSLAFLGLHECKILCCLPGPLSSLV